MCFYTKTCSSSYSKYLRFENVEAAGIGGGGIFVLFGKYLISNLQKKQRFAKKCHAHNVRNVVY